MNEILDNFPAFGDFVDCHVGFGWELDWVILVDVNNDEIRIGSVLLENVVYLNVILFDSDTSTVPSNDGFVYIYLIGIEVLIFTFLYML